MPVVKLRSRASRAPSWEVVLEEFLLHKKAEGRAWRTLEDYRDHLGAFFSEPQVRDAWPDYHKLKTEVRKHFASLTDKSATTYNLRREYLQAFFRWCVREGYLEANPAEGIPKRRNDGRPRDATEEEIKRLLDAVDRESYVGLRDYALILFQLDTGIRPGEALALTPDCVNLAMLEVRIPPTAAKTRSARTVVISPQTAKVLSKLLAARPREWGSDVPLFASQDGTKMLETSWANRLKKYARKAGISVTPYMLRHTSAIMSLRNGASAFFVQRQLGHASLVMTKRYVHLVEADLHREHAQCSPVANLLPQRQRAKRNLTKPAKR